MRTVLEKVVIWGIAAYIISGLAGCVMPESKELDDVAEHGPLKSVLIAKQSEKPLFEGVLAAGFDWDFDQGRFFLSTDQPHRFFDNSKASFYVVNAGLDTILYQK